MVAELEKRARLFAEESARTLGRDASQKPGAGAAGGLGYAFMQYLSAGVASGADLLLDLIGFDRVIKDADLIIKRCRPDYHRRRTCRQTDAHG